MAARKRKRPVRKIGRKMKTKLFVLFLLLVLVLLVLIGRLMYIEYTSGDAYTKKVLSLQSYDSKTIPFQRGDIVDANGTVLATSVAVYNVILDCSVMTGKDEYIEPTIDASDASHALCVTAETSFESENVYSFTVYPSSSRYFVIVVDW